MNLKALILRMKTRAFAGRQDFFLRLYGGLRPGTSLHSAVRATVRATGGAIPMVVKLDITRSCNINCSICYARHGSETMPFGKTASVLDQFRNMSARLDLMGGEPCLHPDLVRIISYAKQEARFSQVQVFTNATLVTPQFAASLRESGLDSAMVNLFSSDRKTHDMATGVAGSWKKTVSGTEHLIAAGVDARPFIVMHRKNIHDYERNRDFSLKEFGVMPVFFQYIPVREDDTLTPGKEEWAEAKRKILYDDQPEHRKTITAINTLCGRCCLGGYYSVSIKVNGDITPCPFIDDVIIGNVFEKTFWEAFGSRMSSESYREFISVPVECRSCTYVRVCRGGCRAGFGRPHGSYAGRDRRCQGPWKEKFRGDKIWDRMPAFF